MSDLQCCPFCGSVPRIYETQFSVKCGDSLCPVKPSVYSNDRDVAISRWNSRPETEEERAAREARAKIAVEQAAHSLAEAAAEWSSKQKESRDVD